MSKLARLLDLVPFIQNHQGIALEELATAFQCTQKEIVEDLNTLWMCGLPGYTHLELMDLDFDSGYVSISNAQTLSRVRRLNSAEVISLVLGLQLLSQDLVGAELEDATKLTERLVGLLNSPIQLAISQDLPHLDSIHQALREGQDLHIEYLSSTKDEITQRDISPIEILEQDQSYYLRAFCHKSQGIRHFAFKSIRKCECIPPSKLLRDDFEPKEIQIEVTIRSQSRLTHEKLGASVIDRKGESLTLSSFSPVWLERALLSLGGDLRITSRGEISMSIARGVKARAKAALDLYLD